ncbi:MAG: hypothetical protein WCO56_16525 [Verrucomicrobiota bacterium]
MAVKNSPRKCPVWQRISLGVALLLFGLFLPASCVAESPESLRSPVNQVFQFVQHGTCSAWTNGTPTTATGYLWIPENCRRLRGLVILCANVPEHMLVGHPAIREVCAAHDLGIFWGTRSFYNFKAKNENRTVVAFLQQLLDGLAKTSGYEEVATVPWLPMGESGHLLMVDALVEAAPQRCIAGIWIKNNHLPPKNREVPALVAFGTAQEWGQDKVDIRTNWNNIASAYDGILKQRKSNPNWPFSYVMDGTSGHFDCSERLTRYFARYIDLVAKARLSDHGSPALKPVLLEKGFLADLPVPGHENQPVTAFSSAAPEARGVPWYFDKASAEEAQAIARINWKADTQLPAFADEKGTIFPYTFNGITWLPINKTPVPATNSLPTPTLETESDGVTFTLKGVRLEKLPENFVGAGQKLARAPGTPYIEWLCGAVEPLGNGKFRMALDRTWPSPLYIAVRHPGTDSIRAIVQPGQISRDDHSEGRPQKITFETISDVKAGTDAVPLKATSDAGLPVRFFVTVGPAIVQDGKLMFTKIPPRTRFPVSVTVAAWQWGRGTEPKVKTAEIVSQTFQILPP